MSSEAILDQAYDIALAAVDESRGSLMLSLRFMDAALWRMSSVSKPLQRPMGTDGYRLYLEPVQVIRRYQKAPNDLLRDYLHTILHCVFRHSFDDRHPHAGSWDLACDIAVEAIALELVGLRYPCEGDDSRQRAVEWLKRECPQLTAQKLYKVIDPILESDAPDLTNLVFTEFVKSLPALFTRDDHAVWTREPERMELHEEAERTEQQPAKPKKPGAIRGEEGDEEEDQQEGVGDPSGPDFEDWGDSQRENDESPTKVDTGLITDLRENEDEQISSTVGTDGASDDQDDSQDGSNAAGAAAKSKGGKAAEGDVSDADRLSGIMDDREYDSMFGTLDDVRDANFKNLSWKDISKQMEAELEGFAGKPGSNPDTFLATLSIANRKQYDYRDFLRRFSTMSEEMKTSTEEFDYVYYTYGLKLYDNMPLVEPLEYQESDRVRDFVIAVDTSGSCAGGLVKMFVEKTYDVLKSSEGFGRKLNVHIVQCDCDIRKDVKITSLKDMDDDWAEFDVRGFGGTDFRPVFKYVDELVEMRELTNLKGLIYFTDGFGTYPIHPPDYETVFAFMDDSGAERDVPPWAMKVVLDEDDIREL